MTDDLIICTRNRPRDLARCLESVLGQTHVPTCTTIVDSSDGDASALVVEAFAKRWPDGNQLVHVSSEPGLVHQRLVGLHATQEPIVHYIDDDTVLEPGYIEGILAAFADADGAGTVGGVGGYVTDQPAHRYRRIDEWLGLDSRREGVVLPSGRNIRIYTQPAHDIDVDWLPGCAMSYRRPVLEAEPPDERVGRNRNGEDVQLSYRIRQRWRLVITPRARLAHITSDVERRSVEKLTTVELVSRWERVHAGTGRLSERAFWLSVFGQLAWYSTKAATTLSAERWGIARATWRGVVEIRDLRREAR
ncbi:MAG: glycosyl transferase family protein [Actinomycetia bacterium]|nr:glycosyl transferase family protein [Actinomycetes bacterium]